MKDSWIDIGSWWIVQYINGAFTFTFLTTPWCCVVIECWQGTHHFLSLVLGGWYTIEVETEKQLWLWCCKWVLVVLLLRIEDCGVTMMSLCRSLVVVIQPATSGHFCGSFHDGYICPTNQKPVANSIRNMGMGKTGICPKRNRTGPWGH